MHRHFLLKIKQQEQQRLFFLATSLYTLVFQPDCIVIREIQHNYIHTMCNGQVERFNQTLLLMLGLVVKYQKSDWKVHVPTLVHAYNATICNSTGYSFYFLITIGRWQVPWIFTGSFICQTPYRICQEASSECVGSLLTPQHRKSHSSCRRQSSC